MGEDVRIIIHVLPSVVSFHIITNGRTIFKNFLFSVKEKKNVISAQAALNML